MNGPVAMHRRTPSEADSDTPQPRSFGNHFVESVFLRWASNAVRVVVGLLALRLVTSSVSEAELGVYWTLTAISALLGTLSDLGIGLSVVRHLPLLPDRAQRREHMQTVVAIRAASLLVLCVSIWALKPWVLRIMDASAIADRYYYVYILVIVSSLLQLFTSFLQGLNRFRSIALFAVASSLARLCLVVFLVLKLRLGVLGLFVAEVAAVTMAMFLSVRSAAPGLPSTVNARAARQHLVFGLPLYVNSLLSYTATRLNMLMVASLSGPTALSYFTVASRIPDQISVMLRNYTSVYLPNMSQLLADTEAAKSRHLLTTSLRVLSFVVATGTLVLSLFRREVLLLLAPPSYQSAAAAVPLLLGGLTFASLGVVLGNTIVALGDSRTPMKINLVTAVSSVVLNLLLIPRWGVVGAAWVSLIVNGLGYGVTEFVLARRFTPTGRGYLMVLLVVAGALWVGYDRNVVTRVLIVPACVALCLAVSNGLRADLRRIGQERWHR